MSLLSFWALNVVVVLLSMEGQKAFGFHQKYLNVCSKDEQRSYRFGTARGRVIINRIAQLGLHLSPEGLVWVSNKEKKSINKFPAVIIYFYSARAVNTFIMLQNKNQKS